MQGITAVSRLSVTGLFFATLLLTLLFVLPIRSYSIAGDWHNEFEDICSKVQDGESLSIDELTDLAERAEKLIRVIKNLDEPSGKVYIFRLKKCKAFFEYMIELKKAAQKLNRQRE